MKIKIFTDYCEDNLSKKVNEWILDDFANVIDIKYSTIADDHGQCFYSVLVMYKEL